MKKLKMLTSILLTLVLCLSFVLPVTVNAVDLGNTITIRGTENDPVTGHTYKAYQIFAADLSADKTTLSNVVWGASFDADSVKEVVDLLKAANEMYNAYTIPAEDANGNIDASGLVELIQGTGKDTDTIVEFANVVGTYVSNKTGFVEDGTSTPAVDNECTIEGLSDGYFLVVDTTVPNNQARSRYLLEVVKDVTMTVKAQKPTLEKNVVVDEGKIKDNTASLNDVVKYELTSTFPDMKEYKEYTYTITDKLSKGLTFDKTSVKVTIDGEEKTVVVLPATAESPEEFYATVNTAGGIVPAEGETEETATPTTVTIDFKNFVSLYNADMVGKEIKIEYSAELNKYAETGRVSNNNTAELEYSNDPYTDSKTKTPVDDKTTTDTYTIDLELLKIEEVEPGQELKGTPLSGAQFNVYKYDEEAEDNLGEKVNAEVLETAEDGKVYVSKLGAGKYVLEEVKAPDGHNVLGYNVVFEITFTNATETDPITWDVVLGTDKLNYVSKTINVDETSGKITLTVQNSSGFQLPSTGGVGTVIFTVVGILVMATVVVVAIKSNKKSK